MTDAADNSVYVKRYTDPHRSATACAHLKWLLTLDAGVRLPVLRSASPHQLVFEHLGHQQPGADDLGTLADALGRLHAAAHIQHLHPARLDQPFPTPAGMVITDFVTPRRNALRRLPLTVTGLPATIYKDANIRNFLLTERAVAIVDFDDLTLAPFGYDLAKLIVTTAMTHGPLAPHAVDAALEVYNVRTAEAAGDHTTCPPERLRRYAEFHHLLTARYLHHNGYVYPWPTVRPWPETGDTPYFGGPS